MTSRGRGYQPARGDLRAAGSEPASPQLEGQSGEAGGGSNADDAISAARPSQREVRVSVRALTLKDKRGAV